MTQFELADRLGISYQAVSNWERGNSMPDIAKLPELAEIFGVTVDEILGGGNPVVEKGNSRRAGTACRLHQGGTERGCRGAAPQSGRKAGRGG